jgi:hypothetical protein
MGNPACPLGLCLVFKAVEHGGSVIEALMFLCVLVVLVVGGFLAIMMLLLICCRRYKQRAEKNQMARAFNLQRDDPLISDALETLSKQGIYTAMANRDVGLLRKLVNEGKRQKLFR